MSYKRVEFYIGWSCNNKCFFCTEKDIMKQNWNKKVSTSDILKKFKYFKNQGFNHITFLGGEPFLQPNFLFGLKLAKKLGFKTLVTTNGSLLQFDNISQKFLPFIDELIISVPTLDHNLQTKITNNKSIVNFEKVFDNISKYWNGDFLKINTVINKINLRDLLNIAIFAKSNSVKELAFVYPDLIPGLYNMDHVKNYITPKYSDCIDELLDVQNFCLLNNIRLIITDIPFCVFKNDFKIESMEDFVYDNRVKYDYNDNSIDREQILPRKRKHIDKCINCLYFNTCWGPSTLYGDVYNFDEINTIN